MTDQDNKKWNMSAFLAAGLLVAVIVQSFVIFSLYKKLEIADSKTSTITKHDAISDDLPSTGFTTKQKTNSPGRDKDDWNPFEDMDDWDPFREMNSMHDRINQMFGSAFNRFQHSNGFKDLSRGYMFSPNIDIEDKGDHYLVTLDVPGVEDSRLDIKIDGQTLTVSGTMQSDTKKENKGHLLRQERRSGSFQRTITLPGPVKPDKMTTENKKGILYITIPKETTSDK